MSASPNRVLPIAFLLVSAVIGIATGEDVELFTSNTSSSSSGSNCWTTTLGSGVGYAGKGAPVVSSSFSCFAQVNCYSYEFTTTQQMAHISSFATAGTKLRLECSGLFNSNGNGIALPAPILVGGSPGTDGDAWPRPYKHECETSNSTTKCSSFDVLYTFSPIRFPANCDMKPNGCKVTADITIPSNTTGGLFLSLTTGSGSCIYDAPHRQRGQRLGDTVNLVTSCTVKVV